MRTLLFIILFSLSFSSYSQEEWQKNDSNKSKISLAQLKQWTKQGDLKYELGEYPEAFEAWKKAADEGYADAQQKIGSLYWLGRFKLDYLESMKYMLSLIHISEPTRPY